MYTIFLKFTSLIIERLDLRGAHECEVEGVEEEDEVLACVVLQRYLLELLACHCHSLEVGGCLLYASLHRVVKSSTVGAASFISVGTVMVEGCAEVNERGWSPHKEFGKGLHLYPEFF